MHGIVHEIENLENEDGNDKGPTSIEDGWRFFDARRAVNLAMKVKQVASEEMDG